MSIFTMQRREEVQRELLKVGLVLIKTKGLKKVTVSQVTEAAGIGKGTFYHFYDSKELFLYDVIQFSKEAMKESMNILVDGNGALDRRMFEQILQENSFHSDSNIVNFISAADEKWLMSRLPEGYVLNVPKEEDIMQSLLENMKGVKKNPNRHVIANLMKLMALAVEEKALLHEDALDDTLCLLKKLLCDEIFSE